MLARAAPLVLALVLAAGCVTPGTTLDTASVGISIAADDSETGARIPYATWAAFSGDALTASGDVGAAGEAIVAGLAADRLVVTATGYGSQTIDVGPGTRAVIAILSRAPAALAFDDATPGLHILEPFEFGGYYLGPEALCAQRNTCGLSEPVLENAPNDVVYASATCCVGGSPPVWVSRDAGATWDTLDTPGIREAVGIEGDFAIDAAGNVYFTDILVGSMWITSWDAEGNWRHTTPVPFEPLVDRPWVRAGAEDVVYFLYNTGVDGTNFHVSRDGGMTFSPVPVKKFPDALGTIAQGPELEHLWVVAGMMLYESTDGGMTWTDGEPVPVPDEAHVDASSWGFAVPAVDPSGRVMVAYDLGRTEEGYAIHAAVREPAGEWNVQRLTENGTHIMPWIEAGPEGGFVVAWYGTDDSVSNPDEVADDAEWFAFMAASSDAGATWQRARADPDPVLVGPMLRKLLDFLQVDLDERGAAHLVYSHLREGGNNELTSYVRTTVGLGLPQLPFAAAEGTETALEAALPGAARLLRTE